MSSSGVRIKKTKVNGGMTVYAAVQKANLSNAALAMGDAILNRARMTVPEKTKALRHSGNVHTDRKTLVVEFGGSTAPYAPIQEFKQFKHYTKKGSGPHYLENAGDSVAKQGVESFMR